MKVYVDDEIESCLDCPCHNGEHGHCQITGKCVCDYVPKSCPLQSLSDHDKQVRKEVCEEIREICKLNIRTYKIHSQDDCERYKEVDAFNKAIFGVLEILDQIEQGKQND